MPCGCWQERSRWVAHQLSKSGASREISTASSSISANPASSSIERSSAASAERERARRPAGAAAHSPCSPRTSSGTVSHGLSSAASQTASASASAASQHAPGFAQRGRRVDHQHVAPAAEHGVDARQLQVDPLAAEHAVGDVRQAERRAARPRELDHRLRLVAADQLAAGLDQARRREADLPRPGREVEHAEARAQLGGREQPRRDGSGLLAPDVALAAPPGRRRLPALQDLAALGVVVAPARRV